MPRLNFEGIDNLKKRARDVIAKDNLPKIRVEDEMLPAIPDKTAERKTAASKLGELIKGGGVLGKIKERLPDAPTKEDINVATEIITNVLRETKSGAADSAVKSAEYLSREFKAVGIEISYKDALAIIGAFKTGPLIGAGYLVKNYGWKLAKLGRRVGGDINEARKNRNNPKQPEGDKITSSESRIYKTARDLAKNPEVQKATRPIIDETKRRALEEISRRLNKKK